MTVKSFYPSAPTCI